MLPRVKTSHTVGTVLQVEYYETN